MGLRLMRVMSPATHLNRAQWTMETASGNPALSCPACGQVDEIEPGRIKSGVVVGIWMCQSQSCPYVEWLTLDAWNDE